MPMPAWLVSVQGLGKPDFERGPAGVEGLHRQPETAATLNLAFLLLPCISPLAVRKASTQAGQEQIAARLNTKRPDCELGWELAGAEPRQSTEEGLEGWREGWTRLCSCATWSLGPLLLWEGQMPPSCCFTSPDPSACHVPLPLPCAVLLKFKKMSDTREAHHLTSYLLAAGIPLSLLVGPIPAFDTVVGLAIPLHFHIGMRSVIIDYVWDIPTQRIAITALGIFTALTAVGLTKFNLTDVGLTKAIKQLWIKVPAEAIEDKKKN